MAVASQGCGPAPYCRRHPSRSVLYQVVQQHLETYLALAGEDDWDGQRVPAYVEREPRAIRAMLHIVLHVIEAHLRRSSAASA